MAIEIRSIAPEETDALIRAISTGFGGHVSDEDLRAEKIVFEPGRALAAVEGETFVGGTGVCSLELSVPGATVPAAGVTSVAVLPTHRRRGILTAMTRRLFEELRGREPVSALWASEGAIYGRFGYGVATLSARVRISTAHGAFGRPEEPRGGIRLLEPEDAQKVLPPVYERVRGQQPGFLGRDERWWRYRFHTHEFLRDGFGEHFFALHEGSGGPDGYAAYRIKSEWDAEEPGGVLDVAELIAETPAAYADLWRYCLDVDLVKEVRARCRRVAEPLLYLLAEPRRLNLTLADGLWVRLVDLPRSLEARRYAREGRITFEVADPSCPWNAGRWELEAGVDGAECRRTSDRADIRLDAADLGAVYLGGTSFRTLAGAGRIEVETAEPLGLADAMFRWDPRPWCPAVF